MDSYNILGINKNFTENELKTAFRKKAKQFHPDLNKSPKAAEMFRLVNDAYHTLSKISNSKPFYEQSIPQPRPRTKPRPSNITSLFDYVNWKRKD